jgi:hypothetical protein
MESKGTNVSYRKKKYKSKNKMNELFIRQKPILEDQKFCKVYSFKNSNLDNRIKPEKSNIFSTEIDYKNYLRSSRDYNHIKSKKNKKNISPKSFKDKNKLFNEVKSICQKLYDSDNEDNNERMKIREGIINKVDKYINSDLKNNILCPEVIDNKKKKPKYITPKKYKNESKEKEKYLDTNLITMEDIIRTYYEEPYLKSVNLKDLRMVTYGNYAKNYTIFNHPQIYTLNNNFCSEKKLIPNKTPKKLKSLELTKLIPERKQDKNEINKQIYSVYKTMKNKKEIKFHI